MGNKINYAFILAAGEGTRLRPYTDNMPKPMVPVAGRPILDHTLDKLENESVKNVTINLYYLGDSIKNHLSARKKPIITLSKENSLLNTGGGIKNALDTMNNEPFYIINGDAFWTDTKEKSALTKLAEMWQPDVMDILLLLQPVSQMTLTHGVGDYDLDENGKAVRALNKNGKYMFGGIRIAKPEVFKNTPDDAFSFLELMDKAENEGRLYGLVHDGEWHHISTPEELDRVNASMGSSKQGNAA